MSRPAIATTSSRERAGRAHFARSHVLLLLACLVGFCGHAQEPIAVQLCDAPSFRFAGIYAAQWQGYFAEADLAVTIRSGETDEGLFVSAVEEVASGRADIGIGAAEILMERDEGEPLVVLGSVLQESPYALCTLERTSLEAEAQKLRVALAPGKSGWAEALAMLGTRGIMPDLVTPVPEAGSIQTLLDGLADVVVLYGAEAERQASEASAAVSLLYPNAFGLPFYGDSLFAHAENPGSRKSALSRFAGATLRGWEYAMANEAEIAHELARRFPLEGDPKASEPYYLAEAQFVRRCMRYPGTSIGHSDGTRWEQMYVSMAEAGCVSGAQDTVGLIDRKVRGLGEERRSQMRLRFNLLMFGAAAATLAFLFAPRRIVLLPVTAMALVLVATAVMAAYNRQASIRELQIEVADKTSIVRARLEGAVAGEINLLRGLGTAISLNPDITRERFQHMARDILRGHTYFQHVAVAPNLVVEYVYPEGRNQAAIGLDYRSNPAQWPAISHALETGETVLAGPVDLVQGGRALIARVPVFLRTGSSDNGGQQQVWGILSGVMDIESLLQDAGIAQAERETRFALKGLDAQGLEGALFLGSEDVFAQDPVVRDVLVPGGSWKLAAVPAAGWSRPGGSTYLIWVAGLFLVALIALLAFVRQRQHRDRLRNERALRLSEARRARAQAVALLATVEYDKRREQLDLSSEFRRLADRTDLTASATRAAFVACFAPADQSAVEGMLDVVRVDGETASLDAKLLLPSGEMRHVILSAEPLSPEGACERVLLTVQDIEARHTAALEVQQLQDQLRESQKMESIGHLAGGIAHDFNNILTSIMGYNELAVHKMEAGAPAEVLHGYHREIARSATRARDLVQQLLTFSRADATEIRDMRPAPVLRESIKMLRAMLPPTIGVSLCVEDEEIAFQTNPVYLNEAMLHLIMNARDALDIHGQIEVRLLRADARTLECASCHHAFSGAYAVISVRDNGRGIPEPVLDRVFEPFFTTKPTGHGSGMGLAVVHGIAHRSDGHVHVSSTPGEGTRFDLYFPLATSNLGARESWIVEESASPSFR